MSDDSSAWLADNVRSLREARGMTQARIAAIAGVPRPTWAHLEAGAANPTLSVLVKVAAALQVSVEELIGPPRATARLYRAAELPVRRKGKIAIRRLLPDPIPGMEFERFDLAPGAAMAGVPHLAGTREYLACEVGQLELSAGGDKWTLEAGDVVVFRGDQKHGYRNPTRRPAVAYSIVVLAPG